MGMGKPGGGGRMIWFIQRKMIEDAFNEWADENGVAKVPNAVVAFLEIKGCLDEDAVNEKFPMPVNKWRDGDG